MFCAYVGYRSVRLEELMGVCCGSYLLALTQRTATCVCSLALQEARCSITRLPVLAVKIVRWLFALGKHKNCRTSLTEQTLNLHGLSSNIAWSGVGIWGSAISSR